MARASLLSGWSGSRDLNPGPPAPEAGALPCCATPRYENDPVGPYNLIIEVPALLAKCGPSPGLRRCPLAEGIVTRQKLFRLAQVFGRLH